MTVHTQERQHFPRNSYISDWKVIRRYCIKVGVIKSFHTISVGGQSYKWDRRSCLIVQRRTYYSLKDQFCLPCRKPDIDIAFPPSVMAEISVRFSVSALYIEQGSLQKVLWVKLFKTLVSSFKFI